MFSPTLHLHTSPSRLRRRAFLRNRPLTSATGDVLVIGLTSDKPLMELRTVADWVLRPRLLAVPGVANVTVFGGEVKQYQIRFRPERLIQYNLTLDEVLAAAQRATGIRGAGLVDTANQRLVLQTEGQSLTPAQLGSTVLLNSPPEWFERRVGSGSACDRGSGAPCGGRHSRRRNRGSPRSLGSVWSKHYGSGRSCGAIAPGSSSHT